MSRLHDDAPGAAPNPPPGVAAHRVVFESAIEPPRLEWFAAGTEMERVSLARSVSAPGRILSPPNGAIIAVDPDIPRENQQVVIAASGVSQGDRLILDDSPFGSAAGERLWQPRSGTHILKLLDAEGRERDRVRFVVRAPN
jgi:penicillin-binding protein 1C